MAVKAVASEQKQGVGPAPGMRAMDPPAPRSRRHANEATHMLVVHLHISQNPIAVRDLLRDQLHNRTIRARVPGVDQDLMLTWQAVACSRTFLIFCARSQLDSRFVQQITDRRMQNLRPVMGPLRYAVTHVLGAFREI
jgi:hypothetical protein